LCSVGPGTGKQQPRPTSFEPPTVFFGLLVFLVRNARVDCSSAGFIFGRFSAIKTKSTWQNIEFFRKILEFF